ncbi:MAG: YigZ family protein [Clostridia bacterium]
MKNYYTIENDVESAITIKKSTFICNLIKIENADDATLKLKQIKKKYADATHNCYGYIANEIATEQRFSDDGEPQGTAGLPILEVLKKREVFKVLAVVTRYFGGVKLGASGLVSAYTKSVTEALAKAKIVFNMLSVCLQIECDYNALSLVQNVCLQQKAVINAIDYSSNIVFTVFVPVQQCELFKANIIDKTCGKSIIREIKQIYFQY